MELLNSILQVHANHPNTLFRYSRKKLDHWLTSHNVMTVMIFALAFGIDIYYHQTMNNTQYSTKTEENTHHDFPKESFLIKKNASFDILKADTSKIVLDTNPDYKELFLYSFDKMFHLNYVRLQLNACINFKTCRLIKDCCLNGEHVVLTDNVLKEIASFCNPYVLEKMITVFTGVDISYELEPIDKNASLVLKGIDWKARNLCKEKQKLFDNQWMDHLTNSVGQMCTTNDTEYDRYRLVLLENQIFL